MTDNVVLVASELMTNAVTHAQTEHDLTVTSASDRLRLQVVDRSHSLPIEGQRGVDAINGRGLMIIGQLVDSWGYDSMSDGKAVWCEFAIEHAKVREVTA